MKSSWNSRMWLGLALFLTGFAGMAWADGLNNNEVEFSGSISSLVVNGEGVGTIFIRLDDFDLRVIVNAGTEISKSNGDPMDMGDLKKEARITITGKYSASGVLASRIRLEDSPDTDFRIRGTIKSIESSGGRTLITLLSIPVIVTGETKIAEGDAALGISGLKPGLRVLIEGAVGPDGWIAALITVQTTGNKREPVRFEGTVISIDSGSLQISVQGLPANITKVILTDKTKIVGDLVINAAVFVSGTLNADLTVTAREIRVLKAFEIKPDEKKLKIGEKATFILKLRESAAKDTSIALTIEDSSIAALSVSALTIPSGATTAEFVVTGGPKTGETEITAIAPGQKATAHIKVGEVSEGENENHASQAVVVFAPDHIKMGLNETRDVVLLIKPPQKAPVQVDLEVMHGLIKVTAVDKQSEGAAAYKVTLQSGAQAGPESVVATLPAEMGGGKAELLVDVAAGNADKSNRTKAEIDFRPHELKLSVGETLEASLISSLSFDKDVTIGIIASKGEGTVELPASVVLAAGTKNAVVRIKGIGAGPATVGAAMPAEQGADKASLNVQVGKK